MEQVVELDAKEKRIALSKFSEIKEFVIKHGREPSRFPKDELDMWEQVLGSRLFHLRHTARNAKCKEYLRAFDYFGLLND